MLRILFCLPFLCLTACQQLDQSAGEDAAYAEATSEADAYEAATDLDIVPPQTTEPPAPPAPPSATDRRLIRTAEMRLQVAELDSAARAITRLVTGQGGFVSDAEFTNSSYQLTRNLTLRVPAEHFDAILSGVGRIGMRMDYQRVHTLDVTEEWVDIESRLATKRTVRDRYIDVLRNRAQTAKDILEAEDKIRVITEEIEAQEARLRSLRDRVAFSTIQLELYQEKEVSELPGEGYRVSFWHQIGRSFGNGWSLVKSGILVLIAIWPLWLLAPVLVYGWRRWRNRG